MGNDATLTCKAATVHFVYSFVLKGNERFVLVPADVLAPLRQTVGLQTGNGVPDQRKGILPHLVLRNVTNVETSAPAASTSTTGYAVYQETHRPVFNTTATINRLVRIFPTGGTCTVSIRLAAKSSRALTSQDVLRMFKLAHGDADFMFEWGGEPFVPKMFAETIEELCKSSSIASWLDQHHVETQDPTVVTVLEIDGRAASDLLIGASAGPDPARRKMRNIRRYESELAPILFRSVARDFDLEPAYLSSPTPLGLPGLFSVNLDAKLNVHLSHRSVLCVCRNVNQMPARYFLPSLLDLCELLRSRWHTLVIMNKILDDTLRDLPRSFADPDPMTARETRRSKILALREWLATSMEDPLAYSVAGDALSRIYLTVREWLRLQALQDLLFKKSELLDRAYQDLVSLHLFKQNP